MSYNLGLNIVETDGRATQGIVAAKTSVTGFIVQSQRGIKGKVVEITSWDQFTKNFGSFMDGAYGAYAIKGFFDNGGSTACVTRVVNDGENPTSPTPVETTTKSPWKLTEECQLTFKTNFHPSGKNIVFKKVSPARLTSKQPPNINKLFFDLSTESQEIGKNIIFVVNNDECSYQFKSSDAKKLTEVSLDEIAAVINREFTGIQSWVSEKNIIIQTDIKGNSASLEVKGDAADVLFEITKVDGDGNVTDLNAVTTDEVVKAINTELSHPQIKVTGEDGNVSIENVDKGQSAYLQIDPATKSVADIFGFDTEYHSGSGDGNASVAAFAQFGDLTIKAGSYGSENPGAWCKDLSIQIDKKNENQIDISVFQGNNLNPIEKWVDLNLNGSSNYFVADRINDTTSGSSLIVVKLNNNSADVKNEFSRKSLANGRDGKFDASGLANACSTAIDLFNTENIQLLVCPETDKEEFIDAAKTHCEKYGDRMFIAHTGERDTYENAKSNYSDKRGNKVYGALYFPWIRVSDPLTFKTKCIPPCGHVAGVYARTERERGIWKAPAGNSATINGALDVKFHIDDTQHTALVKESSINAIRFIPGQGIIIDSSRTLSTNSLWYYVNVRLLFNYVKSSLKNSLRWVVQEPNHPSLWKKVRYNSVEPFLMDLWRAGAFGPGKPEDVFSVKIDADNNPPENIKQGILTLEVYFYPSRPAETIVITIGQQEGGASASEA